MRVDVDKFLTEVNRMFERHAASGTVYVTMKRCEWCRENREEGGGRGGRSCVCQCLLMLRPARLTPAPGPLRPGLAAWGLVTRQPTLVPPHSPDRGAANEQPPKSKADWSGVAPGCLVRATDGKRKISTLLRSRELAKFQDAYATILRVRSWRASGSCLPCKGAAKAPAASRAGVVEGQRP